MKTLYELLALPELASLQITINGLTNDSRKIKPGSLFVAYQGFYVDGRKYIDQAIEAGAVAVLKDADELVDIVCQKDVPIISVVNLRTQLATLAKRFYDDPQNDLTLIGVTGTNGKTSVTQFIAQALGLLGKKCAVIGGLGNGFLENLQETKNTTPGIFEVYRLLADFKAQGAKYVAMEVSSHALDQGRVNGLQFEVGVFTNLTQDHLDYHRTMDEYFTAKMKLFDQSNQAVVFVDDPRGKTVLDQLPESMPRTTYGDQGEIKPVANPNLVGAFNAHNLAAVSAVLKLLNFPTDQLAKLKPVSGRMERFGGGETPLIIVDYAHTPDALEKALLALKGLCEHRLFCVFGCGGDRDQGKRPKMAALAEKHSDVVMVTQDNPRHEDPVAIVEDIKQGFGSLDSVLFEDDRANAITKILQQAVAGDVILIAGKGREAYQEINGERYDYSDIKIVELCLENLILGDFSASATSKN